MNETPLVSVCIPTYNSQKTLIQTLESLLKQTYTNLEIVVVDNASTDNTSELLSDYIQNKDIKYYRNSKTIVAEENFDRCVELAQGEYTAIFHADDLYKPDMVEKQVQTFLENSEIGAVFTLADTINEDGKKIGELGLPADLPDKDVYNFCDIFTATLKNMNFLTCPSAMVKTDIYKESIPFDYKKFKTSSDVDMWLRILKKHPISIVKENLMCYRISKMQGYYQVRYLRTEKNDFSKVMDYHLSKVDSIPKDVLETYQSLENGFNIQFAANHLIKKEVEDAKSLLKKTVTFRSIILSIKRRKSFILMLAGISMLMSIYLKVWKYYSKVLYWYLYGRN
ncbi:MAG TPA: glycosyltransferase [Methanobacteriaceae archaeon]|nr:glycosyltransferase [Methanobacteriaceae archaeon]